MTRENSSVRPSSHTGIRKRPLNLGFLTAGFSLWVIAAGVSTRVSRDIEAFFDRDDAQVLEHAERTFEGLIDQKLTHLRSQAAALAEDARVRSTVVTPDFDEASVKDILSELRKSAGADIMAILDAGGRVQSVTGADEMNNLDLSSSSLVKAGLEAPSAHVWTFSNKVRLLGVAPIQLGGQVLAMFMIGFDLDQASLADIGGTLGVVGGAYVGDSLVVASSKDAASLGALKSAVGSELGTHEIVHGASTFVARSSRPTRSAGAVKLVWLVEKHHEASRMGFLKWSAWAPVSLVGLSFLVLLAFSLRVGRRRLEANYVQRREERTGT